MWTPKLWKDEDGDHTSDWFGFQLILGSDLITSPLLEDVHPE
jgi:hypothetical protein